MICDHARISVITLSECASDERRRAGSRWIQPEFIGVAGNSGTLFATDYGRVAEGSETLTCFHWTENHPSLRSAVVGNSGGTPIGVFSEGGCDQLLTVACSKPAE